MQNDINRCIKVLKNGKTILYPTDTIWGIGCDATNPKAVSKIYKLKQRAESKALICLVSDYNMLKKYINKFPTEVEQYISNLKKPTTVIYNNPILLAKNLIAENNTIAIRIVTKGFAHELIKKFDKPIVSTSANLSNFPSPKSFKEIHTDILKGVDYVVNLPDEKTDSKPSTIIKIMEDDEIQVIRE